jgi:hypothetical protein
MAKFGANQTNVTPSNFQAYVAPGVVNQSGAIAGKTLAGAIESGAKIAQEAYTQNEVNKVTEQTNKVIDAYQGAKDLSSDINVLSGFRESLFSDPTATKGDVSTVEQAMKDKYAQLQTALDQGGITPAEFSDRVTAVLRETSNRNPGLTQRLTAESQRVLQLSGITGVIKQDTANLQTQQATAAASMKDMQTRAKKLFVTYDATTPYWDLSAKVADAERSQRAYDTIVQGDALNKISNHNQALQYMQKKGSEVVMGGLTTFSTTISDLLNGTDSTSWVKLQPQVEAASTKMKAAFANSFPVNIRQQPEIQSAIKDYNDGVDSLVTTYKNSASGGNAKASVENELSILTNRQKLELTKQYDIAKLDMISNLMRANPTLAINKPIRDTFANISSALVAGNVTSPTLDSNLPVSSTDTRISSAVSASLHLGKTSGDFSGFNVVFDTLNKKATTITDPVKRNQFLFNNLAAVAKADNIKMDANGQDQVGQMIKIQMDDPQAGLPMLKSLLLQDKGVELDALPTGEIKFSGENATAYDNKFAVKINTSLHAFANVHGMTTKEAAPLFYKNYFGSYFSGGQ